MNRATSLKAVKRLGISFARGMEAAMKAPLLTAVLKGVESQVGSNPAGPACFKAERL